MIKNRNSLSIEKTKKKIISINLKTNIKLNFLNQLKKF